MLYHEAYDYKRSGFKKSDGICKSGVETIF